MLGSLFTVESRPDADQKFVPPGQFLVNLGDIIRGLVDDFREKKDPVSTEVDSDDPKLQA